ncbi:uncharacterized protein [Anolis sagrei]|uniref:uncharacterized protein n=1 Tax=Anolis sagrei TaxID=38937 RepID=UPI0035230A2E
MGLLATLAILIGHGEASACKPALDGIVFNLAQGRPAAQSSDYAADLGAGKAVDGNCQGDLIKYRSCSHTKNDMNPWWYVDLGVECSITSLVVKNRGDCCSSRIDGLELRVGNSLVGNGITNPLMLQLWMGLLATLATLIGHGEASACTAGLDGIVSNLAKGRPAAQSSIFGPDFGEEKAVDGNCQGDLMKYRSCTHTTYDMDPWWYVDLGVEYAIISLVVKTREDCCSSRINGLELRVGNSLDGNGKFNPLCGVIKDTSSGSLIIFQCKGLKGRYVSAHIPGRQEFLTLCEVEVYGMKVEDVCR